MRRDTADAQGHDPHGAGHARAVASDLILAGLDGRVHTLRGLLGSGSTLLVFVERDCPTCREALAAIAPAGGRVIPVSEGRTEAARELAHATGFGDRTVLVQPAPYVASSAFRIQAVPTFVLVDEAGDEVERTVGWERAVIVRLLSLAGGRLGVTPGLPDRKPGCQSRTTYDAEMQARLDGDDAGLASPGGDVDEMWARGWTDGLPVVPPTHERVAAMLDGRPGDRVLGVVPPAMGELTLDRLASCAVLAGCDPRHFPIVLAAAEAVLDPAFNLHGVQNTTHFAAPVIVVNGPARTAAGMNAGSNVLGFGNRANATIGRAIRLMMLLTGGGTPGGLDQSTLGGPHKWTFCFPEREEASPWEPLHVSLGHDPGESTVTVLAGEGPAGVSDHYSRTPEALAATLALAMMNARAPASYPLAAETLLILCPEHAALFGASGWSKSDLREWIFRRARRPAGELRSLGSGELGPGVTDAASDDEEVSKFLSPDEIVIVVAGGDAGRFSAIVAPWVGFGLGSGMVTREVE